MRWGSELPRWSWIPLAIVLGTVAGVLTVGAAIALVGGWP